MLRSIEENLVEIAANDEHPLHKAALRFQKYCEGLWAAPQGREFIAFFCALAHPYRHAPCSDPVLAAHVKGRAEMTAVLLRYGAPTDLPLVPELNQRRTPCPPKSKQRPQKPPRKE